MDRKEMWFAAYCAAVTGLSSLHDRDGEPYLDSDQLDRDSAWQADLALEAFDKRWPDKASIPQEKPSQLLRREQIEPFWLLDLLAEKGAIDMAKVRDLAGIKEPKR